MRVANLKKLFGKYCKIERVQSILYLKTYFMKKVTICFEILIQIPQSTNTLGHKNPKLSSLAIVV